MRIVMCSLFAVSMTSAYLGAITYRALNGDPAEYPIRYSDNQRHDMTKLVRAVIKRGY